MTLFSGIDSCRNQISWLAAQVSNHSGNHIHWGKESNSVAAAYYFHLLRDLCRSSDPSPARPLLVLNLVLMSGRARRAATSPQRTFLWIGGTAASTYYLHLVYASSDSPLIVQ